MARFRPLEEEPWLQMMLKYNYFRFRFIFGLILCHQSSGLEFLCLLQVGSPDDCHGDLFDCHHLLTTGGYPLINPAQTSEEDLRVYITGEDPPVCSSSPENHELDELGRSPKRSSVQLDSCCLGKAHSSLFVERNSST